MLTVDGQHVATEAHVVVHMSGDDLYETTFASRDEAVDFIESCEEKRYLVSISAPLACASHVDVKVEPWT